MGFEQLSLNGFIQEMKEVTDGAHPRRFCFVLGAGASIRSGIKSGQELVRVWDKDLVDRNEQAHREWRKEFGITDENMSSFYSQYYERRFARCPSDGLNYIEKIMESAAPSAGYVLLSYILTKTPHNVVITTNFDHLTEDAVNYYAHSTPLVVGHEALARYIVGQPVRPTIIKIHRDLLFDPKSSSAELETLAENWVSALGLIFSDYHPVFIGYAGNDNSLMNFLISNASKFRDGIWKFPYWMIYKNSPIEGKVKTFLDDSDGYIIRHDGFDSVMIQMGAKFGYKIPTEDTFLDGARERFRALKDAIDAFSDKSKTDGLVNETTPRAEPSNQKLHLENSESDSTDDVNQAISEITSESDAQRMFRNANMLLAVEKYSDAADILQKLVDLEPNNARYRAKLSKALLRAKDTNAALIQAKNAIQINPESGIAHFSLAEALQATQENDDALREYKKAAELDSDEALPHYAIGELLSQLGNLDEALAEYKKAVELDPDWAVSHHAIGELLSQLGNLDEALAEYKKAVELDPDWVLPHYDIGKLLEQAGNQDEALAEYKKAEDLDPDWAVPHFAIGKLLAQLGNLDEALAKYRKVVDLDPDWAVPHHAIGELLEQAGNQDEALAEYKKAVDLDPDWEMPHYKIGQLLAQAEKYDEALQEFQLITQLSPENIFPYISAADLLSHLGRNQEAIDAIEKAYAIAPDSTQVQEVRRTLTEKLAASTTGATSDG